MLELKKRRGEIGRMKQSIKVAERERKIILKQQKMLLKDADLSTDVGTTTTNSQEEGDKASSVVEQKRRKSKEKDSYSTDEDSSAQGSNLSCQGSPSKIESFKRTMGTTLKTPLSPKLTRRRHSSADSDDSMSVSQVRMTDFERALKWMPRFSFFAG